MNQPLKISIPKPCHENWQTMIPDEQGRFCLSCQKSVIDFTGKSKEEIQAYFKSQQGKEVCGRFQEHQLSQELSPVVSIAPAVSWWKAVAVGVSAFFASQLASPAKAQTTPVAQEQTEGSEKTQLHQPE